MIFAHIKKSLVLLLLVMAPGAGDLAAQIHYQPLHENAEKFVGTWSRKNDYPRGNCGGLLDDHGRPRNNCAIPVDKMPLNARARAWNQFFDERLSPLYDCIPHSLPSLFGDVRPFHIVMKQDRVEMTFGMGQTNRTIWLDGRSHPNPYEIAYHGFAIGHWEGDELVVDTRNFTFDPDGMDDHAHLPSSTRKKLTERYKITAPGEMTMTITVEDPAFLTKPFTYQHYWTQVKARPLDYWAECDPEVVRREIDLTVPEKYPDK